MQFIHLVLLCLGFFVACGRRPLPEAPLPIDMHPSATVVSSSATVPSAGPTSSNFVPTSGAFILQTRPTDPSDVLHGTLGAIVLADADLICSDTNDLLSNPNATTVTVVPFAINDVTKDLSFIDGKYFCNQHVFPAPPENSNISLSCLFGVTLPNDTHSPREAESGFVEISGSGSANVSVTYDVVLSDGQKMTGAQRITFCDRHLSLRDSSKRSKMVRLSGDPLQSSLTSAQARLKNLFQK